MHTQSTPQHGLAARASPGAAPQGGHHHCTETWSKPPGHSQLCVCWFLVFQPLQCCGGLGAPLEPPAPCPPSPEAAGNLPSHLRAGPRARAGWVHPLQALLPCTKWCRAPALPDGGSCRFHRHQHQALGIPGVPVFTWS